MIKLKLNKVANDKSTTHTEVISPCPQSAIVETVVEQLVCSEHLEVPEHQPHSLCEERKAMQLAHNPVIALQLNNSAT